jgi:ABC-type antimicrobial peptide transport system permease subunit
MTLAAAGMALGAGIAFGVSRFAGALLYGVRPTDPLTFVTIVLLLAAATAAACLVPARRAARLDPVEALRAE